VILRPTSDDRKEESAALDRLAPWATELGVVDGRATAYVCRGRSCGLPVTSVDEMLDLLSQP
jgi:uncharacterized protein YyaL (SSP411 family)